MIHIDPLMLNLIVGSILPIITGIVTKESAAAGLKSFVSFGLSGLVAVIELLTKTAGVVNWRAAVIAFFTVFIVHVGMYFGFLKPSGIAGAVQRSTSNVGIS